MTKTLKTGQQTNIHARLAEKVLLRRPFHILRLFISISCLHLSSRAVASINTPKLIAMDTFWWIDKLPAIAVEPTPECLTQTFVLASSSWACERSLWGSLLRALRFPFGCAVLCGLVPVCGSAIVRRSSRSPSRFRCLSPCRLVASNLCQV
jgi:hypothetical protein